MTTDVPVQYVEGISFYDQELAISRPAYLSPVNATVLPTFARAPVAPPPAEHRRYVVDAPNPVTISDPGLVRERDLEQPVVLRTPSLHGKHYRIELFTIKFKSPMEHHWLPHVQRGRQVAVRASINFPFNLLHFWDPHHELNELPLWGPT